MDQITILAVIQLHQWSMVLQLTAAQIHLRATATAPQALPVSEPLGACFFLEEHPNIL